MNLDPNPFNLVYRLLMFQNKSYIESVLNNQLKEWGQKQRTLTPDQKHWLWTGHTLAQTSPFIGATLWFVIVMSLIAVFM